MLATEPTQWSADDIPLLDGFPEGFRYEASDGVLEVTPPPELRHDFAADELLAQIGPQLPADLRASTAGLSVRTKAGWRVPDLVVHRRASRQPGTARWLPADEVLLVVEVESPTGLRRDREIKPAEYAEVGVPAFWRVERTPGLAVVVTVLDGSAYVELARLTAAVQRAPGPLDLVVDLERLRRAGEFGP